eukprot:CAMPEP_0185797090 /NCGR_PEP_ID=MMETSP1174-20130828/161431_1 /TAXON_ID=35687 /ORGANISM="Dictyocha speculum, Strain CCMP1381" /LENGTH=104 /DNA_ID=CAMNT_0028492505 /DNA_START=1181 /DNA_END=1493 /DNA_ORIENTATION=+
MKKPNPSVGRLNTFPAYVVHAFALGKFGFKLTLVDDVRWDRDDRNQDEVNGPDDPLRNEIGEEEVVAKDRAKQSGDDEDEAEGANAATAAHAPGASNKQARFLW